MGTAKQPILIVYKMNKLKFIFALFLLIYSLLVVSSCYKEAPENYNSNPIVVVENSGSDHVTNTIDCGRKFPATACYPKLFLRNGTRTNSPCSDCKEKVSLVNPNDNYKFKTDMKKLGELFEEQISIIHGSIDYKINLVTLDFGKDSEFVKLEYQIGNEQNIHYSIAFITQMAEGRPVKGPIVVNCGAGSTGVCTEKYNANTGEIYCQSQDNSCKMTISD